MVRTTSIALVLAVFVSALRVEAQTSAAERELSAPPVALHHAPLSVAAAADPLRVVAALDHPELVRRVFLVYGAPRAGWLRASSGAASKFPTWR